MPLPAVLSDMVTDPAFWAVYLLDDDFGGDKSRYDEAPDVTVDLPVADGFGLRLEMKHSLWYHELRLVTPASAEDGLLGWDDGAHFHPHVFRWDEFDLLCRAMALADESLRYPGPAAALLVRFAFLSGQEDLNRITPVVDAAYHSTRPAKLGWFGYWAATRDWLAARDLREFGIVWARHESGAWAVDPDYRDPGGRLYTLRHTGDSDFPFHGWQAMLDRAEQALTDAIDPAWRSIDGFAETVSGIAAGDLAEGSRLASLLRAAGCRHGVVLRALEDPAHPIEMLWILELVAGMRRGDLIAEQCGPSPWLETPQWREAVFPVDLTGQSPAAFEWLIGELDLQLQFRRLGLACGYRFADPPGYAQICVSVRGDNDEAMAAVNEMLGRYRMVIERIHADT